MFVEEHNLHNREIWNPGKLTPLTVEEVRDSKTSLERHLNRLRHVAPVPTVKPYDGTVAEFKNDIVNHPAHYTSHPENIECIQVTRYMNFNLGNVIKYLWREGLKNTTVPIEDLKKARWYLDDEIKLREKQIGN